MLRKKKIIAFSMVIFIVAMFFSCENVKNTVKEGDLFVITNPYTGSMMVFDKSGKSILKTDKPRDEYLSIIKDAETGAPVCLSMDISGEQKMTNTYTVDDVEYSYDYASHREVLYNLDGTLLPFDKNASGNVDFALNGKLFYIDEGVRHVYDLTSKEDSTLPYSNIGFSNGKLIVSGYLWGENGIERDPEILIYDKNIKLYKTIKGYAYDGMSKIGGKDFVRVIKAIDDDNTACNFLDKNFSVIFDAPLDNRIYAEDKSIVTCRMSGTKFDFDFSTLKVVSDVVKDDTAMEKYDPDEYDREQKAIMQKFADIDSNANWYTLEKHGKKYFYNSVDKEYNKKDHFSLYDEDKNIIIDNIKEINAYLTDDNVACDFDDGTKIYGKDFTVVNEYKGRHMEPWGFSSHEELDGKKYYSFRDKDNDTSGILDDKFDIIIDGLKTVTYMDDGHFTYLNGFEYGFMDYSGKVLYSFSIFDDIGEESTYAEKYTYGYYDDDIERVAKDYPRVDGSTANMPMMAEIRSSYLGEDKTTSENNVKVTTTDYAWRNLLEGKNDLLLVYEPSSETKRIITDSPVKLRVVPIGVDALVFVNNEKNIVNNLSTNDLIDIYTGNKTNWSDFGGDDKKIEAFQRPLNSGSQTLFLNLLMKDHRPSDAPKSYRPQGMDDLIEVLASYDNDANAIGYSVFYYAKKMYKVPGLRLLSVDGIEPSDETIASGKYPFLNEYYIVIREDTDPNSETMRLYNYILSAKGREAIIRAGYIPR